MLSFAQADFPEGVQITGGQPTVTLASTLTATDATGLQTKVAPQNIEITQIPLNYSALTSTLGGHLSGIDSKLGALSGTTAGISTRVWFTADQTTITAGTFDLTNPTGKGTAASHQQTVANDDGQKKYFTTDLIGQPFAMITTFPAGTYAGNLTASTTPTNANQRFTVELYKCNNAGTPIASGVTGAVVGDLGVTTIMIMDSGEVTLANASITNVSVATVLGAGGFTIQVGERIRYHVSAAKAGTAGGVINESVYYGSSYNSFIDVPVIYNSSSIKDVSAVTNGSGTVTDALNTLNTGKVSIAGAPETITSQKTFSYTAPTSGGVARGTIFSPSLTVTANNDILGAIDINPVFNVGAFTGVARYGIRSTFGFAIDGTASSGLLYNYQRNPFPIISAALYGHSLSSSAANVLIAGSRPSNVNVNAFALSVGVDDQIGFDNTNAYYSFRSSGTETVRFISSAAGGRVLIQNGGTFTDDGTNRLQVGGTVLSTGFKVASTVGLFDATGLTLPSNPVGTSVNHIKQSMDTDFWKIYGEALVADRGKMVFEVGDNGIGISGNGQSFEFRYDNSNGGVAKTPLIIDYNDITALVNITATSFIKSGATASSALLAGGAVLANPVSGTANGGQLSFWDTANTQTGDDNLFWDNVNKRFGVGANAPVSSIESAGASSAKFVGMTVTNSSTAASASKTVAFDFRLRDTAGTFKSVASIEAIPTDADIYEGGLVFYTRTTDGTPTEKMRIATDGNLVVDKLSGAVDSAIGVDTNGKLKRIASSTSYKVYTALLTQTGTGAPTATVLENTLGGTVVWARTSTGDYTGTLSGAFTTGKTVARASISNFSGYPIFSMPTSSVNSLHLVTSSYVGAATDGVLDGSFVEIRVYP